MGDITAGNATAATMITIIELGAERSRARGTATRATPASTTAIRTERGKPAVTPTAESSTASVRGVQTSVFKVTGRLRRAIARHSRTSVGQTWAAVREAEAVVGGAGAISDTWQQGKVLVSTHFPSR